MTKKLTDSQQILFNVGETAGRSLKRLNYNREEFDCMGRTKDEAVSADPIVYKQAIEDIFCEASKDNSTELVDIRERVKKAAQISLSGDYGLKEVFLHNRQNGVCMNVDISSRSLQPMLKDIVNIAISGLPPMQASNLKVFLADPVLFGWDEALKSL
jgi:hypothetical protein